MKASILVVAVISLLSISACQRKNDPTGSPIFISGGHRSIAVGQTVNFSAVGSCSSPLWLANHDVVSITPAGTSVSVTGSAPGVTTLQVECSDTAAFTSLQVTPT